MITTWAIHKKIKNSAITCASTDKAMERSSLPFHDLGAVWKSRSGKCEKMLLDILQCHWEWCWEECFMSPLNYDTYFTFMYIKNLLVDLIFTESPLAPSSYVPVISQGLILKIEYLAPRVNGQRSVLCEQRLSHMFLFKLCVCVHLYKDVTLNHRGISCPTVKFMVILQVINNNESGSKAS